MNGWVNFRDVDDGARFKMKLRDGESLQKLLIMETRMSGPIWISRSDFPGCLNHVPESRPNKRGQVFKSSTP